MLAKQNETLHELQLRLAAVEAHQHRTWRQFVWGRKVEADRNAQPSGMISLAALQSEAVSPSELPGEEEENLSSKNMPAYMESILEVMEEFVDSAKEFVESVTDAFYSWLENTDP
jgi:hypothetical protein